MATSFATLSLWITLLTLSHIGFCSFDCSDKRCCSYKDSIIPSDTNIDCATLTVEQCIENYGYMCKWDCTPTKTIQRDNALKTAGFTLKKYIKISKGNGVYHEPKLASNTIPTSTHTEPTTVAEVIKYTRMSSVDSCGVVYEYEMDEISAQAYLEDDGRQDGESDANENQTERLIRRLTIFNSDGRSKITNGNLYRWSGYLQFSSGSGDQKRCSASLIYPKWIVTAAHCVHSGIGPWDPEWFSEWKFYPGAVNGNLNYLLNIEISASNAMTFGEWTGVYGPNWDWDIGWIELDNAAVGYPTMSINYNDGLQDGSLFNMVGYPGDKAWLTQWYQRCSWAYIVDEFMVTETCDIYAGSSGSAVYQWVPAMRRNEINCIVSWENEYFNGCARITKSKYEGICAYMGCV